ncbi:MAG: exodeoxyribonuclease V subunit alpha [Actinophytocola sp.]|nr:exodeoxyribonuclease V subunit alpha [Actinophytocola sp.]
MTEALITLRASGALRAFQEAGVLAAADVHVALRLGKLGGEDNEEVLLAAALTVRALRLGSVCVELDRLTDLAGSADAAGRRDAVCGARAGKVDAAVLPWPEPRRLVTGLRRSPLVAGGPAGPLKPLVLVESTRGWLLYLTRYHRQEETIRGVLAERARTRPTVNIEDVGAQLDLLFPGSSTVDRQRVAAALAATEWTTIIAGGPGTGKTHTAARILALLYALDGSALRVALAAPTGKAAARLQEAVTAQASELGLPDPLVATTLHRLLGWRQDSGSRFAHHANNRLPHDVVVLDETSMVSLTIMARLVEALRPETRLILLGDPDQLASVDAGAVLADLVARQATGPANGDLARLLNTDVPASGGESPLSEGERERLRGGIIRLRHVHRFGGAIADLADAVRRGATDEAVAILGSGADDVTFHEPDDIDAVADDITATGSALIDAADRADVPAAFAALGRHRVLCAHREGPHGVRHWTRLAHEWLSLATGRPLDPDGWYPGRPLLITETDYEAGLSNGDTGAVIQRGDGLAAAFDRGGTPLMVHPSRLSAVQTAYAMTIHRSQGSQYDTVTVVLPDETSALLTRQLLYTAITRARRRVRVIGHEAVVRAAIERQALRASGLA